MKRVLTVSLLCLLVAGCSGLVAKPDIGKAIAADVPVMAQRANSTQPAVDLAANAVRFDAYYSTATVNGLAWLFGPKGIFCSATIYSDLQGKAARANEFAKRMRASTQPSTQPVHVSPSLWLQAESTWMQNIERERQGK